MDEPPKKPHGIGWYAAWAVLALVLYVASVGPAAFAFEFAGGEPDPFWDVMRTFYAPLKPLADPSQNHPVLQSFSTYVNWCCELAKP